MPSGCRRLRLALPSLGVRRPSNPALRYQRQLCPLHSKRPFCFRTLLRHVRSTLNQDRAPSLYRDKLSRTLLFSSELQVVELRIQAPRIKKLPMTSPLDDPSFIDYEDHV